MTTVVMEFVTCAAASAFGYWCGWNSCYRRFGKRIDRLERESRQLAEIARDRGLTGVAVNGSRPR